MWYFYRRFEANELEQIISDIDDVFDDLLHERIIEYPVWISSISKKKLLNLFEDFKVNFADSEDYEKGMLREAYTVNCRIEELCNGLHQPISYTMLLENGSQDFRNSIEYLKKIQEYLYSNLPEIKYFKDNVGTLGEYYSKFYDESVKYVCPFCGIDEFLTSRDKHREHFDHYIPKATYPFVSLLRENLYPMCSRCNSAYKGANDITENEKVFYPFSEEHNDCELSLSIQAGEVSNISISSEVYSDQISTWDSTWDIRNRVKNHIDVNIQGWMSSIQEVMTIRDLNIDYETAVRIQISSCTPKFQKQNFIKKEVLESI